MAHYGAPRALVRASLLNSRENLKPARKSKMNNALLKLLVKLQTLSVREDGQDLVEYALVVGLISIAAVATLKNAATAINGVITSITSTLSNA